MNTRTSVRENHFDFGKRWKKVYIITYSDEVNTIPTYWIWYYLFVAETSLPERARAVWIFCYFFSRLSTRKFEEKRQIFSLSYIIFFGVVELTSVVKFLSFYLFCRNHNENFNINVSHISNDMCKVWRALKRGEWRYRLRPSMLFAFFEKSSLDIRIMSYNIKLINKAFARYRTPPK